MFDPECTICCIAGSAKCAIHSEKPEEKQPAGLYRKYLITKADGRELPPEFEAFVLRLDDGGDPAHVAACRAAVLVYADEIEPHISQLARDLRARYSGPDSVNWRDTSLVGMLRQYAALGGTPAVGHQEGATMKAAADKLEQQEMAMNDACEFLDQINYHIGDDHAGQHIKHFVEMAKGHLKQK